MAIWNTVSTGTTLKNKNTGENISLIAGESYDPNLYNVQSTADDTIGKALNSNIITSENIQPISETQYKSPENTPIYDITKLPTYEMTAPEEKTQSLSDELQRLNESLVGESAYRTEQESAQDIAGLIKTKTDLSSQLKILQNEAFAIPQQMQQMAEGRGMTAGGLAPLQTARLRENSIKALTTSALLEAANSNLSTAQTLVDRAVAAKYDPIKAQIDAKTANLKLIQESPEFTLAEKKRAAEQQAILDAQTKEVEMQEANQAEIWNIATTAANNGADALTLQKIQKATTKEEAMQIATEAGVYAKPEILSISDAETLGVPYGTTKEQAIKMGLTPGISGVMSDEAGKALYGEYGDIIKSASNLVGSERGKTSKAAIAQSIADGDFASAYAQIANNVEESLTGTSKSKFADTRTDYSVMIGLKDAVQAYADAGGDMGLLKGKEEEIKRNLGIDSGKASELAVQLWREFQTYRVNMTGAAFSEAESKDYASVNPTLGKTLDLNLSVINGALNQMENRITSTINSRIPNAKKIYEKVGVNQDGLSDDDAWEEYQKMTNQSNQSNLSLSVDSQGNIINTK